MEIQKRTLKTLFQSPTDILSFVADIVVVTLPFSDIQKNLCSLMAT